MSTSDKLKEHVKNGVLKQFLVENELPQRGLFMPVSLYAALFDESGSESKQRHLSTIRAKLGVFVGGEFVDNCFYMKRLRKEPLDIWEIRIDAIPQCRIFGMFPLPDTFICSHIVMRKALGNFESAEWKKAKAKAKEFWEELFPGMRRFSADSFSYYITLNGGHYDWNDC